MFNICVLILPTIYTLINDGGEDKRVPTLGLWPKKAMTIFGVMRKAIAHSIQNRLLLPTIKAHSAKNTCNL